MTTKKWCCWLLLIGFFAGAMGMTFAGNRRKKKGHKTKSPVLRTRYGKLKILPPDNPWNQVITNLPVHDNSDNFINSIGSGKSLHPDFGAPWKGVPNGIPYMVVGKKQKQVPVAFEYAGESDRGPYPIPDNALIEGGPDSKGDRHIILIAYYQKKLYELYNAFKTAKGWKAGSGAIFDLGSNKLRRAGWTSADAAGLPIFPGLARYEEVARDHEIRHALRFTVKKTQRGYISPARHFASRETNPDLPPMGLRLRLKAGVDISGFPPQARIILQALKTYGMILADNGSDWYISGAPHPKWNNDDLHALKKIKGQDFEVVDTGRIVTK